MSAESYKKPLPIPNDDTQVLFDGLRKGQLMIQRCKSCGEYRFVSRQRCDLCGSAESEWTPASGKAKVITYAYVHQKYHPGFADELPYNIATVELEEGPRLTTNLVELGDRKPYGGMPVEVVFEKLTDEISLHKFKPVS